MKVVITARNFSNVNQDAINILLSQGYEVEENKNLELGVGANEDILYEIIKDADAVIAGLEPYQESLLNRCPRLQLISRRGIGYDSVDIAACVERGITVARTSGEVEGAVAEQVIAYILYFARHVEQQSAQMHEGLWQRTMQLGAKNRTLGLVGFGGIGKEIAKRAKALGMNVVYYCRHPKMEWEQEYHATYLDLDAVLQVSDFVSVNVPLTPDTEGMFGVEEFRKMKEKSYFINIARSPIMDVHALKEAIECGHLAGAAVDVYPKEPCTDSELIGVEHVLLTPHTAPYTEENFLQMNKVAAQNVCDYFHGCLKEKNRI